ncbi:non-ribosomal peptide synthetase [Actinokineospora inagensis]|uniref:non-ribosomal peptide synthetase n=1 Tax=Actinokineospora inagensis TaxID=103730 RepID=UPI0003F98C67|nr:non-ribosomal peptide synthetase [Actinokineospora inagensis]
MNTDQPIAYDPSPFQRSTFHARPRHLRAVVDIPKSTPAELRAVIAAVVARAGVLTARPVTVDGLLVPRQEPTSPRWTDTGGRSRLTAGTLTIEVTPTAAGTRLVVECDPAFADATSIGLLFSAVVGQALGDVDFFDVAAGHNAMVRSGELAEETAFWADPALRVPPGALTLAEVTGPAGAADLVPVELDWEAARVVADRAGAGVADLAHLALAVVLRRIDLPAQALGITVDAREVMGLPDVIGPLTQVVPAPWRLDVTDDAVTALRAQAQERARTTSMAGGPALDDEPPTIVLNTSGPAVPPGWELVSWSCPVDGRTTLGAHRRGEALVLSAESADAGVLLSMWGALLADLLRRPETALRDLALVPPGQADELARELTAEVSLAPSLVERFNDHVAAIPDAPAVRHGDTTWTYAELAGRVDGIATALGELDPGAVVAVIADHEPVALAALLATALRGGTFLPLSPDEPEARLRDAVERSGARVVLVGTRARIPANGRAIVLSEVRAGTPGGTTAAPADPGRHAYLLRTSGSTGVPKLVGIRWSSVDNYLRWAATAWLADDAEMPVLSSPVFDASLKQTLGVLYASRCVWMPASDRLDTAAVHAELAAAGVPLVLNCVPSYLAVLLDSAPDRLPVRRFLCGGEVLKPTVVTRLRTQWPDAEVWNLYGPTEATATATAGVVVDPDDITVGRPVAGAGVLALDAFRGVLPRGVRGELAITGPGLATGYVSGDGSPFVRLAVGEHQVPAYRTGDIGVVSTSGTVAVVGRADDQVKVNGWRIELGEVEAAALRAAGVTGAAVALDDRAGEPRLRLFVTGNGSAVEESLRTTLPAPMIPSSVTVLDRLDTTPSGKVDRHALLRRVAATDEGAPPEYDTVELEVATVWRDVVRHGWPRADDDFFGVGGHSLLLARVVNVLRSRGYEQLSLRKVVRRPTVASIAAAMRTPSRSGSD